MKSVLIIPDNIGTVIAQKRLLLNMTQEEVAKGICSIPYLSKIENKKIEANEDTLMLICNRLGINFKEEMEEKQNIKDNIEKWWSALRQDKHEYIELYFKKLSETRYMIDSTLMTDFMLIETRYLLYKNKNAEKALNNLKKIIKTLSPNQLFLFYYIAGLFDIVNLNFNQALCNLKEAESINIERNINNSQILYHLSLVYSHIYNPVLSVFYGEKALDYFKNMFNYKRSIDCNILLGINYARIHQYQKALSCYNQAKHLASDLGYTYYNAMIHHNIGFLYTLQGQSDKAIYFYDQSLKFEISKKDSYLLTLVCLIDEYINLEKMNMAKQYLEEGLHLIKENSTEFFVIKFSMLENKLNKEDYELQIGYLEQTSIPYFKKIGDRQNLIYCYESVAKLCSDMNMYKKSSKYYNLAFKLMRNLLSGNPE